MYHWVYLEQYGVYRYTRKQVVVYSFQPLQLVIMVDRNDCHHLPKQSSHNYKQVKCH